MAHQGLSCSACRNDTGSDTCAAPPQRGQGKASLGLRPPPAGFLLHGQGATSNSRLVARSR
eukprot:13847346-Heterocapsa_arctica.AAC.1